MPVFYQNTPNLHIFAAQGRDNNFNLVRIIAAFTVLVSHSYTIALGMAFPEPSGNEPLFNLLGMTAGTIAVHIFFVTSGFLVTGSLLLRGDTATFLWARSLRIFPGLMMMIVLTVFLLGPTFTSATDYFDSPQTWQYFIKCSTLLTGIEFKLPGVFDHNPIPGVVNSSLWTLPLEILMYLTLVMLWVFGRKSRRYFDRLVLGLVIVSGVLLISRQFYARTVDEMTVLFFMFFSGALFYVAKERIRMSRMAFWLGLTVIIAAAFIDRNAFFIVYALTLPYLLFYLAYVPSGFIRRYNGLGDYSYGVYIYGFPVQQSVVALASGISPLVTLFVSGLATTCLAALSWHFVERRALALKTSNFASGNGLAQTQSAAPGFSTASLAKPSV